MRKAQSYIRKDRVHHSRRGRESRSQGEEKLALLQRTIVALIARGGAAGVTHRKVATEAGVSLSATTYYFNSKRDMVQRAFQFLCDDLRSNIDALVSRYGNAHEEPTNRGDGVAAAGHFMRSQLQADAEEQLTLVELMLHLARDEETRHLVAEDREAIRDFVVSLMERSHSSNPDEDADLLMALVTGLLLESLARGRPAEFEARAVSLTERVMGWLTPDEPDASSRKKESK